MRIALITDSHWGVRNDAPVFMDHIIDFHENQFFPYLKKNNITNIIHLGDVFDRRKYINFNTLHLFNKHYIQNIIDLKITADHIVGNHDTYYKNTNDINALKEIYFNQNINHPNINFYWKPLTKIYDGKEILLLPWIPTEEMEDAEELLEMTTAPIIMAHLDIQGFLLAPRTGANTWLR